MRLGLLILLGFALSPPCHGGQWPDLLPNSYLEASYGRLTIRREAYDRYRVHYFIDLPNPVLRGKPEPGSGSIRDFKIVVFNVTVSPADLYNQLNQSTTPYNVHPLRSEDCHGAQLPTRRPAQQCRVQGQFETTASPGKYLTIESWLCPGNAVVPFDPLLATCLRLAAFEDARYAGNGLYVVQSPQTPVRTTAQLLAVEPSVVYSRQYPKVAPVLNTVALQTKYLANRQNDVVKLRLSGDLDPSIRGVPRDWQHLAVVGSDPRFRVRYRYDSASGKFISAGEADWIDAGVIVGSGASGELFVEIPRDFLLDAPCIETITFVRVCDNVDIEVSMFDVLPNRRWQRMGFRYQDEQDPTEGPLFEILSSTPSASVVSLHRNNVSLLPERRSHAKIHVIPQQVVMALAPKVEAPILKAPCDASNVIDAASIDLSLEIGFSAATRIDGFEVQLQYFQPTNRRSNPMMGAWLRYPGLTTMDLPDGETLASHSEARSQLVQYGTRWRWRAAGRNQTYVATFSDWCFFALKAPWTTSLVSWLGSRFDHIDIWHLKLQ